MEKIIGYKILHKGTLLHLTELIDRHTQYLQVGYFYTDIPDVICLVVKKGHKKYQKQQRLDHLQRISNFSVQYGQGAFRKYEEDGFFSHDGQKYLYALYLNTKTQHSLNKIGKWFSQGQILELAQFLLQFVKNLKKKQLYFGGLKPSRIYQTSKHQKQFQIIGGENSQNSRSSFPRNLSKRSQCQFIQYLSPQQLQSSLGQLNYKSDLFVAGCIIYELIANNYPFSSRQNLLKCDLENQQHANNSELFHCLVKRVLKVNNPKRRAEPEELLNLIDIQRTNVLFMSQKNIGNLMNNSHEESSLNILQNLQDFFVKHTKQTEGWFLHYCDNTTYAPDEKFMDFLIKKVNKKQQKIKKLLPTMQRMAENCTFTNKIENKSGLYSKKDAKNQTSGGENTWTAIKIGMAVLNILRKSNQTVFSLCLDQLQKVMTKILNKNPDNGLLLILCKLITMKILFHCKVPYFRGNFYLKVSEFLNIDMVAIQYLSQYTLKLVSYIGKFTHETDEENLMPVQKKCLELICDQLYDSTSILLYCLMAIRKDISLELRQIKSYDEQQKTIGKNIKKLLSQIQMLSQQSHQISIHHLYSVLPDYYSYQEELCLIYQPILSSYEYFFIDNHMIKGLRLPENYNKIYNDQDIFNDEDTMFSNRNPIKQRRKAKQEQKIVKEKAKTNHYKNSMIQDFNFKGQGMKSQGSKISNPSVSESACNLGRHGNNSDQFSNFPVSIECIEPPKTQRHNTKSTASELEKQFDFMNSDISSYQWLKNTEKIMKHMLKKPEFDANIHFLFQQICKGLKLRELIEAIDKNKKIIIDPTHVLFQKVIGSGSAGEVYIGKYQEQVVAIKKVKLQSNPGALKQFERQVLTFVKIKSHPNLVSLVGMTKFNQDYFLLTQFCEGGSLFDLLHKKIQINLSWQERLKLIIQMAKGMKVLHDMNPPIIHRDLKSLNVFIAKVDGQWTSKVADFGLSRSPDTNLMTSALGTLHWMAPQLLSNKQYSLKVDVYSFAIVLWEICCRKTPYHTYKNPMQIVKHVVIEKGRPLLSLINEGCPAQLISLMKRCWDQNSQKRPYFEEIIDILNNIKI